MIVSMDCGWAHDVACTTTEVEQIYNSIPVNNGSYDIMILKCRKSDVLLAGQRWANGVPYIHIAGGFAFSLVCRYQEGRQRKAARAGSLEVGSLEGREVAAIITKSSCA